MRTRVRRLAFGMQTILGLRRRGFFIPYRYADDVPGSAERRTYPALAPIFASAEPAFTEVLARMDHHAEALLAIGSTAAPEPRWDQDWFPRLDAAAAYVLVRDRRPRRIVEIGSGHSTRFQARAVRDGRLATTITAIDPAPRAALQGLDVTLLRETLRKAGFAPFEPLQAGDVLFIDSSHILMPGTDVDILFNDILPGLAAGVLVHVHDIFLPDAYPPEWEWRGYNEQLGVAALLQGGGFRILWSSRYVASRMAAMVTAGVAGRLALAPGALESSLWVEKRF